MKQIFEEIKKIKSGKKQLREFGFVIGGILILFAGIGLWRHRHETQNFLSGRHITAYIGILFVTSGIFFYNILKPLQKLWMGFSIILGFFMSRVILGVLFYLVVTPIALVLKIMGKDILDQKIDKAALTYWGERKIEQKPKESYENQY